MYIILLERCGRRIYYLIMFCTATGRVDCADWSSFALLSVNGNVTAGMVGMTRCLNEFEVGESFDVDATEVSVTFYASDIINTGFMLDYTGRKSFLLIMYYFVL